METSTTQDRLKAEIDRARTNADTANKVATVLDEWKDKHFDRRFVNLLEARLGDGYTVIYYKGLGGGWNLHVAKVAQPHNTGIYLRLASHPTTAVCRERLTGYLEGVESDSIKAAMFELTYLEDIRAAATRIQGDITGLVETYGRYEGRLTHYTHSEVKRILEGAQL